MTYKDIIQQIKSKNFSPIYILHGEEPYFIDLISDYIEDNALDLSERDFNQRVLWGKDVKPAELFAMAKGFPMMANNQVIIVKEAQSITPADKFFEMLQDYLENPQKSTILVLCHKYKKIDARRKFVKVAQNIGVVFETPRVFDDQVSAWVKTFVKEEGYSIGDKAAMMLAEFVGNNLSRVNNELKKLYILTEKGQEITPESIEINIGISKDYNVFELYKSLAAKKHDVTFKIIQYFGQNSKENPPAKIIPMLFFFFNKVLMYQSLEPKSSEAIYKLLGSQSRDYVLAASNYNVPKLIKIIQILREYDMKAKGVNADNMADDQLLKEMIIKVAYVQ